jgi:hypothetical protein
MARISKAWLILGGLFVVVNVLGIGYALAVGEPRHAIAHVVIIAAFYMGWLLGPWRSRQVAAPAQIADPRIDYLQQSVDAVALEVERLGEKQRYDEKLRAQNPEVRPPKTPREEE